MHKITQNHIHLSAEKEVGAASEINILEQNPIHNSFCKCFANA